MGHSKEDFPIASRLATEILSLPIYPEMTDGQVEYVVECLNGVLARIGKR